MSRRTIAILPVHRVAIALMAFGALFVWGDTAWAQAESLDSAIDTMRGRLEGMADGMASRAQSLLWGLLVIDLVLRAGRWAILNEGFEKMMEAWLYSMAFVIIVYALTTIIPDVIAFLVQFALDISTKVGASDIRPTGMVSDGISRAVEWLDSVRLRNPGTWFYLFVALASILVLAMTIAMLVVIYAEIYLVGLAGIITLGFAGLTETRGIAKAYFMMLVGLAFKLMGLLVIVTAAGEITTAVTAEHNEGNLLTGDGLERASMLLILQVITGFLILTLPSKLEALVTGAASSNTSAAVGMLTAVASMKTAGLLGAKGWAGSRIVGAGAVGGLVRGAKQAISSSRAGGTVGQASRAGLTGLKTGAVDWGKAARQGNVRQEIRARLRSKPGGGEGQ